MSPEYKIDLSKYDGPMTVVGYPDLSVGVRAVGARILNTTATSEKPTPKTQNLRHGQPPKKISRG